MAELFDPLIRVTLLEQCQRFCRETGATLSSKEGLPTVSLENSIVEIHLTKFHVIPESYLSPDSCEDGKSIILRYYFEKMTDYRNLQKVLLSCFGKKAKTELYCLPKFRLPKKSFDLLMSRQRIYLDESFMPVDDYRLCSYAFFVLGDGCIQYGQHWGLDKVIYQNCEVFLAEPARIGVAV